MRIFFKTNITDIRTICNLVDRSIESLSKEFSRGYTGNGNYYYIDGSGVEIKVVYKPTGSTIDLYHKIGLPESDTYLFYLLKNAITSSIGSGYYIAEAPIDTKNYAHAYRTLTYKEETSLEDVLAMCRSEVVIVKRSKEEYNILFVSSDQETGEAFKVDPLCEAPLAFPCVYRNEEFLAKSVKTLFHIKSAKLFDASLSSEEAIDFTLLKARIFSNDYNSIIKF